MVKSSAWGSDTGFSSKETRLIALPLEAICKNPIGVWRLTKEEINPTVGSDDRVSDGNLKFVDSALIELGLSILQVNFKDSVTFLGRRNFEHGIGKQGFANGP